MFESVILANLIFNEEYLKNTFPYLKPEYFSDNSYRLLFELISTYIDKYGNRPTKQALDVELENKKIQGDLYNQSKHKIAALSYEQNDLEWLVDNTEKFCQNKAIYNAIMESVQIYDGKSDKEKGSLPQILSDALAVSFSSSVGHDFIDDAASRYEFYNRVEEKIPFDLDYMNKITDGGLPNKSLNIILAGTGAGKSLFMCHMAAGNILAGKNVLYITLEMSEERIAERIDANLMNINIKELKNMSQEAYEKRIGRIKSKASGKLIIKEYPTTSASVNHFRHLLNELKLKKRFKPDIIYVDYINICASARVKMSANSNSYTVVKAIAEELRGLATEYNLPVMSATQVNRDGLGASDVDLTNTSESIGLPQTSDLMFALITTEELEDLGQVMIKQLKNRYNDPGFYRKFILGIDRAKMKLYDVEQTAQSDLINNEMSNSQLSNTAVMSADKKQKLKSMFN